jgi:hypothetical protein
MIIGLSEKFKTPNTQQLMPHRKRPDHVPVNEMKKV